MHARTTRLAPPLLTGLCRPASSAELAPDKRRRHMFALASDHERPARERCELVALPPHHGDWPVWVCCQPNTPKEMHRKPRGPLCDKSSIPRAYIVLEISYLEHAAHQKFTHPPLLLPLPRHGEGLVAELSGPCRCSVNASQQQSVSPIL